LGRGSGSASGTGLRWEPRWRESPKGGAHYHLVLLAKNNAGYRNLVKLSSLGYTEGFYSRPRVDRELLARTATRVVTLEGGTAWTHGGGFATYHEARAERHEHLDELARTFDAADAVAKTLYRFRSDISAAARPIAIDGSRELIQAGNHREAVFWIVATFARCHTILALDAPELQRAHAPAFDAVVADLGIHSSDLRSRGEAVINFFPRLWETAEDIMSVRASLAGGVRPQAGP